MNKTAYPNLGEQVYEGRTASGLLVRVVPKPGFAKIYGFLAVDYGSMDTTFWKDDVKMVTPQGVAHYLEHKMFDMPSGSAMQDFSRYGGNPNAFTSYDITAYYVECTEHVEENLKILLDFVNTPYFTPESVEKERGIIAQEIRMYEDSADSRVYEALFAAAFAQHPVRNAIAGTVESIGAITDKTLYDCYNTFYVPDHEMLCVVGDVDPEAIFRLADSMTPARSGGEVRRVYGAPEAMTPLKKKVEMAMEVSMPTFALGFKTEPAAFGRDSMLQEVIGELAAECLMGESSPLYTRLYQENLIDSDFSCGYEGVKGMSLLTASGDSSDPEAVYEAILEEAKRLAGEGVSEALFAQLKRSALGRRIRGLDSFESICYRMCAYHFEGVSYFSFPEIFREVTLPQVEAFLRRTVQEERSSLSIIRPLGEH